MNEEGPLLPTLTAFFDDLYAAFIDTPILRIQQLLQTKDLNPAFQNTKPLTGAVNCIQRIAGEEGIRYFWRSYIPLALTYCMRQVSDLIREFYIPSFAGNPNEKPKEIPDKANTLLQEGLGTIDNVPQHNNEANSFSQNAPLSLFIVCWGLVQHPFDVIQLRLACNFKGQFSGESAGIASTFRDLLKTGGIKNLYRGYIPLTLYSLLDKNVLSPVFSFVGKSQGIGNVEMMFFRDLLLYPLVVISSRLMMQPGNPLSNDRGVIDCVKSTYKNNGIRGFYQGFQIPLAIYLATTAVNLVQKSERSPKS